MYASIISNLVNRGHRAQQLASDRRALSMLEYGLIAGAISLVCVTAFNSIGPKAGSIFNTVDSAVQKSLGGN